MENLKELIRIIAPKRMKYVSIMDYNLNRDSKLMQLYMGLKNGKVNSDDEAIHLLYGKEEVGTKYSKLKYSLQKRLINTLHLIELNAEEISKRKRAYLECTRAWTTAQFLIMLQAKRVAIQLLEKSLKKMILYDFTMLVLESAKILRQDYGVIGGDQAKIREYDEIVTTYIDLFVAETKVEGYFHYLMSHYVKSKASQSHIYEIADRYIQEIESNLPTYMSSGFIFRYKMIEIIKHMSVHDYQKTIEVCEEAMNMLMEKSFVDGTGLAIIYYQWIACCTQLKQYAKGKKIANKCLRLLTEGDYNWFKGLQVYAQLLMYAGEYQEAYEIYLKAVQHKNFSKLSPYAQEEWKIYDAYIHLLIAIGKIDVDIEQKNFRLSKFLNEVPFFSQDKRGMNIPILICQILFLLHTGKYDTIIDRLEAIQKYNTRYLKEEGYIRSYYFIKMIMKLPKTNFTLKGLEEEVQELYEALSANSVDVINNNHDLEILPYEQLWEILCSMLVPAASRR